jgi:hypothetical protein
MLSIINLDGRPGRITARLFGDNGGMIGDTRTLEISANGKLRMTDQTFFVNAGGLLRQGYLEISSDGVRICGSVVFGDPGREVFSSALPLVGELKRSMVFSQLASDEDYFTGIALVNPGPGEVRAVIDVYDAEGNRAATGERVIPAHGRSTGVLTQYFPSLAGQNRSSGYIVVNADGDLAGFALFGTHGLTALSAVPAQGIR